MRTLTILLLLLSAPALFASTGATTTATPPAVVLHHHNQEVTITGTAADQAILEPLYGPNWRRSTAFRTAHSLRQNATMTNHIDTMVQHSVHQQRAPIHIIYDDSIDSMCEGEDLWYKDPSTNQYVRFQVQAGETADDVATRLGVTKEQLAEENPDRFNVWPHAYYGFRGVYIPEHYGKNLSDHQLDELIVHEVAHTVDLTASYNNNADYGFDEKHYLNEVTTERAAWIEGWAEYNQFYFDNASPTNLNWSINNLRRDSNSVALAEAVTSPTLVDYRSSESTVASIIGALDNGGNNREQVMDTFHSGNQIYRGSRTIDNYVVDYALHNRDDGLRAAAILDAYTGFQMTEDDINLRFPFHKDEYMAIREQLRQDYEAHCSEQTGPFNPGDFINQCASQGRFDANAQAAASVETDQEETRRARPYSRRPGPRPRPSLNLLSTSSD